MREEIKEAASILMDSILSLLQEDPHGWSTRPCSTCRTISGLISRPFGCYKYAEDKKNAN